MSQQAVQALIVRAIKTFLQGAASVLVLNLTNVTNISGLKALAIGAVAAGVSAVMNAYLKPEEAK